MIWWRRRDSHPADPNATAELEEARQARQASKRGLAEVCDRWPEVTRVTRDLRRNRERNGFAELIARALGEGHGDPSTR